MKFSQSLIKTQKTAPADEVAENAKLLIRAGFIYKEMAGVYAMLPLGFRVLEKIKSIVREEMDAVGGQELIMTTLQRRELWEKTDRWDDEKVDVWFKSQLKNGHEVGLGWSHEEQITEMMKNYVSSWRDLPLNVYQFQNKMRNEVRAKSGIMRCREFVMKDLYSYSRDEKEHKAFYDAVTKSYHKVFDRIGIGDSTYFTFASGGAFTRFSHEFQTLCEAGEDTIYLHKDKNIAINEEVLEDDVLKQLDVKRADLEEKRAAEVGNIFSFGGTKSEELGLYYNDGDTRKPVILGSYGIGVTRLIGVVVEKFADNKGMVWPEAIAPAKVHLVSLRGGEEQAEKLYSELLNKGVEVIFDDRELSAGAKLADADLIGIPNRLVCSQKTAEDGKVELTERGSGETSMLKDKEFIDSISS